MAPEWLVFLSGFFTGAISLLLLLLYIGMRNFR